MSVVWLSASISFLYSFSGSFVMDGFSGRPHVASSVLKWIKHFPTSTLPPFSSTRVRCLSAVGLAPRRMFLMYDISLAQTRPPVSCGRTYSARGYQNDCGCTRRGLPPWGWHSFARTVSAPWCKSYPSPIQRVLCDLSQRSRILIPCLTCVGFGPHSVYRYRADSLHGQKHSNHFQCRCYRLGMFVVDDILRRAYGAGFFVYWTSKISVLSLLCSSLLTQSRLASRLVLRFCLLSPTISHPAKATCSLSLKPQFLLLASNH